MKNKLIIFVIVIIILYIIYNLVNEKMESNSEYMIIKRNNNLIKEFNFYIEDLQYYLNRDNEIYVKSTNKNYGTYILNMHRYRDYYKNRFLLMLYPIKIRKSKNNYYIDYNINGTIVPNKIFDESWLNFEDSYPIIWGFNNPTNYIPSNSNLKNFPSKSIITIYSKNENVIKSVSDILKSYNNYEIQICIDKLDLLLNKVLSMNKISKLLGSDLYNNLLNGQLDKFTEIINKTGIDSTINSSINSILNSDQFNQIIESEEISSKLNEYNLSDIQTELVSDNSQITIETRNDKYVFIYNINDLNQKENFIELLDYIQEPENLSFRNSIYKKIKITKLPINPYRILILLKQYGLI